MCMAREVSSGAKWRPDDALLCRVGIQQREVPGPGTAPLLTPGIPMSCVLGVVDVTQDGRMGE